MKVLIAAGGTGGHIYPGIAIAQELQAVSVKNQVLFIGSEEGIEKDIVPKERFSIALIRSRGMLRKLSYKAISSPFIAIIGIFQSLKIIKQFKPDAVVVTGGYVSIPVAIAAFLRRIPVLLHEENTKPGVSARIIKWFSKAVSISFEESKKYFRYKKRVYHFGNPVRREIYDAVKGVSVQNLGLRQDKKILLVMGGSQGARSVNNVLIESLPLLAQQDIQVLHVSGHRDFDEINAKKLETQYPFYTLIPYMYNMADGVAAADLIISRAGATAISEIVAKGVPSILIPFPYSAEGHQNKNADFMLEAGASHVLKDKELSAKVLVDEVSQILNNKDVSEFMKNSAKSIGKPDAGKEIVKVLYTLAGKQDVLEKKRGRKKKDA